MTQTLVLKDLFCKFLDKVTIDYELCAMGLPEKWVRYSESLIESAKTPTDIPPNNDSCFYSNKPSHIDPTFRKHPSISEPFTNELERGKVSSATFEQKTCNDAFIMPTNGDTMEGVDSIESKNKYYVLSKTTSFLQKAFQTDNLEQLSLNSYFLSTYVLEMGGSNELLIKCVALSHFISMIMESFSSDNHNGMSEIYSLVNSKQVILNPHSSSIFSEEQLRMSFLSNFKKILTLRDRAHISFTKLAKSFAYIIWQKPVFLESLVVFLKEMMILTLGRSSSFIEKEMMTKVVQQIWSEPRRDLLKLLSDTVGRTIEIYQVKDNRLEQSAYKPNLAEEKKVFINNKVSLLAEMKNERVWVALILNISEKECFERLDNLSKEEIVFLEEETLSIVGTSKSVNLIPKEKATSSSNLNYTQDWKKSNTAYGKCKEVLDIMGINSDKLSYVYQIEKSFLPPTNTISTNVVNPTEFKENIMPKDNDKYFNSGNKVERVNLIERNREKSRSRSPMIYYNQPNPYAFDARLKTINTIPNGTYVPQNPVIIDNRVRRHYTTNHLPTISNNLFSFN